MRISEYRAVWIYVLFDLPVGTKRQRRAYARFRKLLKKDGFTMLQFSVYVRHCASGENAEVHHKRVRGWVPSEGKVSMLDVTDKQYNSMQTFWGRKEQSSSPTPQQLELF